MASGTNVADRVGRGAWNSTIVQLAASSRRFEKLLEDRYLTFARVLGSWSSTSGETPWRHFRVHFKVVNLYVHYKA